VGRRASLPPILVTSGRPTVDFSGERALSWRHGAEGGTRQLARYDLTD
jgi:hypothetical protein